MAVNEEKWRVFVKYFIHGLGLTILSLFQILLFAVLSGFRHPIFAIVAYGIFAVYMGWANSFVTGLLWFKVKQSFWNIVLHGATVTIILLGLGFLFYQVSTLIPPGLTTDVVRTIAMTFVSGFLAKSAARWWRAEQQSVSKGQPDFTSKAICSKRS